MRGGKLKSCKSQSCLTGKIHFSTSLENQTDTNSSIFTFRVCNTSNQLLKLLAPIDTDTHSFLSRTKLFNMWI